MYWLSLRGAKNELEASSFNDKVALKYYLAFVVWQMLIVALFGWPAIDLETDPFFLVLYVLVLAAPILESIWCWFVGVLGVSLNAR